MSFKLNLISKSPRETIKIARELGERLKGGEVLSLEGTLGSGKTLFVQGLAQGLKVHKPGEVRSPTFSLIQEHRGRIPLCHADLFRLSPAEAKGLGLEEYWRDQAVWVTAVEWAEKAGGMIPRFDGSRALRIRMKVVSGNERTLTFSGGNRWKKSLNQWTAKFRKKS